MSKTAEGFIAYLGATCGSTGIFLAFNQDDVDPARNEEVPTMVAELNGVSTEEVIGWLVTSIVTSPLYTNQLICVGRLGRIAVFIGGQLFEEEVPLIANSTAQTGFITNCNIVAGQLYVVGLGGQAFVADVGGTSLPSNWRTIAVETDLEDDFTGSLFAIDGFGAEEIYAAGLDGEVRLFDGGSWQRIDVGTNANFHAVLCAPDGLVYLAGQDGILLRGRRDVWDIIELDPIADIVVGSLAWFRENLWISSEAGLWRYDGAGLEPIEIVVDETEDGEYGTTYGRLAVSDRRLWSIGSNHVCWTEDGLSWTQVFM